MNTYILGVLLLFIPACDKPREEYHHERQKIVVTSPCAQDVTITQPYVCQIHSCRHIEVRALESGYLEEITVKEGQSVKQGDSMFKVNPALLQAKLDAEIAEAKLAQLEFNYSKSLAAQNAVSPKEAALFEVKLAKAQAKVKLSQAELNFANVKAPFDGILDRLRCQQGSLVAEGDILTTLSDNSVMWTYFNVPEARYLDYKANLEKETANLSIELVLADHSTFPHSGKINAIEADFNNDFGTIAFRADFPNPDALLRHGQTGNVLVKRTLHNAIVIPQRATFEILDKRYVFMVDEDGLVRQSEIAVQKELDDIYVIKSGVAVHDRIVLEVSSQLKVPSRTNCKFYQASPSRIRCPTSWSPPISPGKWISGENCGTRETQHRCAIWAPTMDEITL